MISAEVLAADYGTWAAGDAEPYPWKHVDSSPGLTFWFRRLAG